jgi:hypothetical protein
MLRNLKSISKSTLAARDGGIGAVHDFRFNDEDLIVRHLVADTARWLPGRKVLPSPGASGLPAPMLKPGRSTWTGMRSAPAPIISPTLQSTGTARRNFTVIMAGPAAG